MSLDKTVKCPICGRPYKFYAFTAADQSACPKCVAEAEDNMRSGSSTGTQIPWRLVNGGGDD